MSAQSTSDAEIVIALRLIQLYGNIEKAARGSGVPASTLKRRRGLAESRGLTAESKVLDEVERLRQDIKLKDKRIEALQREEDTAETVRKLIYNLSERTPEPPAWIMKDGKPGSRGVPMTIWSDWHWGEVVNPDEVGGVNEYNTSIAKKRVEKLVNTTIDLAYNHMGRAKTEYPGIIICLGGDMIGGDIHEELAKTNDSTTQQSINDITDTLAAAIETMASKFGKVFLPCVVGNHGRSTKKMQMKQRVYTSHEWNVYCNLERYFRREKLIQFMVPPAADAFFNVYGHRYMLTHGDSLGVKGGDGIIGALGPIMRGSLKTHRSEAQIGQDFDTLLIGHWHQSLWLPSVIVNNALKGYDEYARLALRAPYSRPSQALWFTHPEHGITARWEVFLEKLKAADEGKEWLAWR